MPLGGSPIVGLCAYSAVKLAGYSFAGKKFNDLYYARYNVTVYNFYLFGIARTLLGILVGIGSLYILSNITSGAGTLFFVFLIPIRFLEWFLILYVFYEREIYSFRRIAKNSALGIMWSFILDIPTIASLFVIPGGIWVC